MWQRLFFILFAVLFMCGIAIAADKEEVNEIVKVTQTDGEISTIASSYISIIYKRDDETSTEYEMMFPLTADVKFTRKTKDALKVGDRIRIKSDEYVSIDKEGKKRFNKKVTKEIQFLSPSKEGKLVTKER